MSRNSVLMTLLGPACFVLTSASVATAQDVELLELQQAIEVILDPLQSESAPSVEGEQATTLAGVRTRYHQRVMVSAIDGTQVGAVAQLPDYPFQGSPVWSPDGKQIAFDAWKTADGMYDAVIVVMAADGSKVQVLGDGCLPSFSPNGKSLVYSRYGKNSERGVWIRRLGNKNNEPELFSADGWSGRWSPVGREIAYLIDDEGRSNICIHNLKDNSKRYLISAHNPVRNGNYIWNFSWSKDGKYIGGIIRTYSIGPDSMRQVNTHLYCISTEGDEKHFTTVVPETIASDRVTFTPDNKLIHAVTTDSNYRFKYTDVDGREQVGIPFKLNNHYSLSTPDVSPDGKMILFIMNDPLPEFAQY